MSQHFYDTLKQIVACDMESWSSPEECAGANYVIDLIGEMMGNEPVSTD